MKSEKSPNSKINKNLFFFIIDCQYYRCQSNIVVLNATILYKIYMQYIISTKKQQCVTLKMTNTKFLNKNYK